MNWRGIPKDITELKKELKWIIDVNEIKTREVIFSLSLLYLLNELVPEDRTTKHILEWLKDA